MSLSGSTLVGGDGVRERVENDFYATPLTATTALLKFESFKGRVLEPACGQGHIIKALNDHGYYDVDGTDIIQREDVFGTGIKGGIDFLSAKYPYDYYDHVITNPPFSLAQEFIEKSLRTATKKVAMFCKIQLLEGISRKRMFQGSPLKTVYVFSHRVNPLRNGVPVDERGKPWSSTMCFAWFVWDKSYEDNPTIRWI
jgi:hypothetical protein